MSPSHRRFLVAAVAAATLGLLGSNTLPLVVGASIDALALEPARGGLLGSLEIGAMAAAALLVAPRMGRVSLRRLALLAGGLAAAAQLASGLAGAFGTLAVLRTLAGAGSGAVAAAANAAIASTRDPDRVYAHVTLLVALGAAGLYLVLPAAISGFGLLGLFACLGAVALVCLPLFGGLPDERVGTSDSGAPGGRRVLLSPRSLVVLGGAFVMALGEGALWAFTERIGLRVGFSAEGVGGVLALTTVVGTAGAGLAAWLGTRVGRTLPVAGGLVAIAAASWVITHAGGRAEYAAAQLAYNTLYLFLTPFLLGTAAAIDRLGRVAAALGGITLVGSAFGPVLGGAVVGAGGHAALGMLTAGCIVLAALVLTPICLRLDGE